MKGLDNTIYMLMYIIVNVVALVMLWASWKQPRLLRLISFLLFAWASWTNWSEVVNTPQSYLDYADLTFWGVYQDLILGWFSKHILLAVGFIASCQAMIAVSMLLKGMILRIGAIGAVIFLVAIIPLGVGSAFPCTLIMAIAMWSLIREKQSDYLWISPVIKHAYSD